MRSVLINTTKDFNQAMKELRVHRNWMVDTETTGLYPWHGARICGVSVSAPVAEAPGYYFPFRHEPGGNLHPRRLEDLVSAIAERDVCTGWNYKFDLHHLGTDGLPDPERLEDVMLAAHLVNENELKFGLKELSASYLGKWTLKPQDALMAKLREQGLSKGDMWRLHPEDVADYAGADVVLTRRMRRLYLPALKDWGLDKIWDEVNEYVLVTLDMERNGLCLDLPRVRELAAEADRMQKRKLRQIVRQAGYDINLNSPKQVCAWLGVESSAKKVLEELPNPGPHIKTLLEYRQWNKALTSYYRPWLEKVDRKRKILHPNIKLHGTVSGRPSCEDPNLQAVPRESTVYKVKEAVVAPPGCVLVSADYSQAELRFLAWGSKDEAMTEILMSGRDLHTETSEKIKKSRDDTKRINFGSVYGIGALKLSKERGIPLAEAEEALKAWHQLFKRVRPFYRFMETKARYYGYIRLWTGRVRHYFSMLYPEHHKAMSNYIQGGVAEIMRHALLRLRREIRSGGPMKDVRLLMQVHDQVLFAVPRRAVKAAVPKIREIMEDFPQFSPPVKVEIKLGTRWSAVELWQEKSA